MSDTTRSRPDVDLAALIPAQRTAEPAAAVAEVPAPGGPAPERLAFLWTLLGALSGAAIVAVAFLVLLTLLP